MRMQYYHLKTICVVSTFTKHEICVHRQHFGPSSEILYPCSYVLLNGLNFGYNNVFFDTATGSRDVLKFGTLLGGIKYLTKYPASLSDASISNTRRVGGSGKHIAFRRLGGHRAYRAGLHIVRSFAGRMLRNKFVVDVPT